jgi:hypothetical protein
MKKTTFTIIAMLLLAVSHSMAQKNKSEQFGGALNLGVGLGYYGYVGHSTPVLHADYELAVGRNFTLAPFIAYYSYQNYNYWGDPHNAYRDYSYRETVVPMGLKGTYYFDRLLGAGPRWDFYLAGSLGFALRTTTWENGYYGSTTVHDGPSALFLDLHVGTEYHLSKKAGLFLDLSTGVSTIGLSIHF